MAYNFIRLQSADGTWEAFLADWRSECDRLGEDFDSLYLDSPINVIRSLAENPEDKAAVYALKNEKHHGGICQVNVTGLPGYQGDVLRVRMMYFAPTFDFEDHGNDEYGRLLRDMFSGVLNISNLTMAARHVKFHLRSPGDKAFFSEVGNFLDKAGVFESVTSHGAWLCITKK